MPDPFESLRLPLTPAQPGPAFTQRLRARVERALDWTIDGPKGAAMTNLVFESPRFAARKSAITPYLAVAGARVAIDWYGEAFGAHLVGEPIIGPDGRVGHSELEIGGARLFLSDEAPQIGVTAPEPGHASVTLHLEVFDADETVARATAAGAHLERAVTNYPYGRMGVLQDPFGHRWMVMAELPATAGAGDVTAPSGVGHGDIGYASLWVADASRAARFFSRVLGWRSVLAGAGYQVQGLSLHHGIYSSHDRPTLYLAFAVRDVNEAARAARESGGVAGRVTEEPWGLSCMCKDDQGARFSVYQPLDGVVARAAAPQAGAAAPPAGHAGDLAYVTMEVSDSESARAFYGNLLGWSFSPGSTPDGWRVEGPQLMVGLSGGHLESANVPVYQTADVAAAVKVVREAGGTSTAPEARPYGLAADCTDDQGARFGLWQP